MKLIILIFFSFLFSIDGQEAGISSPLLHRIFIQTSDSTVTNITSVETSMFGSGVGSRIFPVGFWDVGRTVEVKLRGICNTSIAPLNTKFNIKLGSTTLINPIAVLPVSLGGDGWELDLLLTCRTNNSSIGAIQTSGSFKVISVSGILGTTSILPFKNSVTIMDTVSSQTFDIMLTNTVSTTSMQTKNAIIVLYP